MRILEKLSTNLKTRVAAIAGLALLIGALTGPMPASAVDNPCLTISEGVVTDGKSCVGSITLPDTVTSIGTIAFRNNTALTSVNMPQVTTIGQGAFSGNTFLTNASMPSVTSIGAYAFTGNIRLTSVTMPQVTTIGAYSFDRNSALTSVTMPQVTTLGEGVFSDDIALASVTMPRVTDIGAVAFQRNTALVSVDLPASLISIDAHAFWGASGLAQVAFAGNAPTVGLDAFSGVASRATANITYPATGFGADPTWNGLLINRAAAPYVEPIVVREVPSINVTGITGSGDSRTITGTLLASVTSVVVQGLSVSVSNQSDDSLTFIVPNLAAGRYDILMSGSSGHLTWQEGLVVAQAVPSASQNVKLNIFGFTANSAKLTSGAKATINRAISSVSATSIKCAQGASKNRLSATQQKLSISRAKAVCAYAASRAPKTKRALSSEIFQRVGAPTSFVRLSIQGQ